MDNTEVKFPDQSAFEYDYETLQTTGLILGIVMFVTGILIALSKKCTKCEGSSSNIPEEKTHSQHVAERRCRLRCWEPGSCGTDIPHKEMPPV